MWQKIQTYTFVTLITILVWLYAEGENLKVEEFSPEIVFVPPQGRKLLIEPSRPPRRVDVEFRGPNSKLQEVMRNQPIEIELRDDPAGDDTEQTIDLAQRLATHSGIMQMGLNVQRVVPATVKVRVERMETRTLPIEVSLGGDYLPRSRPTLSPAEAVVTLPASLAAQLAENVRLTARLPLNDPTLNQQTVFEDVPLSLPFDLDDRHITIEPESTSVTVTLTQKTKQSQPMNIPIHINAPISEVGKYDVRLENGGDPFLRNVILEGPNAIIDEINQLNREIRAELRLSASDLENAAARPDEPATAQVTIPTPDDVRVVEGLQTLKYRVIREDDEE